uniref:Odorant receptor n=1 Tax=Yemma signatus TaxID=300820 RepID=A0A385H6P6_9HEMI|nr:odorant receptor [Yemma signatus]
MPTLRFYNFYRGVLLQGRWSALPLPWHGRESFPNILKVYGVMMIFYLIYKIVCTTYAIMHLDKFEIRVYLMSALFYFISSLLLMIFFYLKGAEYRSLIDGVDSLTDFVMTSGLGEENFFQEEYKKVAIGLAKFSRFMAISAVSCPAMFCLSVPFIDYLHGEYRARTAVPAQCPVELEVQHVPGVFEIIVIQQGLAYSIPSFQKFVTEIIMLSLFNILKTLFEYLSRSLKHISKDLDKRKGTDAAWEKFHVWVRIHQASISLFESVIILFSPLIVMYYLLTIVVVAGALLYMTDANSSNILQTLFGGGYMLVTMFSLFLQCQAADEASSAALNLADEIYRLPWHKLDTKRNSSIRFILEVATKTINVDAYHSPAFRLSKKAYHSLFVNTVSAYMGFRKIMYMQHQNNP